MRNDKTRREIVEMVQAQRRAEYDKIDAIYAPILNALHENITDEKLISAGWIQKGRDIHQRGVIWEKGNRTVIAAGGALQTEGGAPSRIIVDLFDLVDFENTGR